MADGCTSRPERECEVELSPKIYSNEPRLKNKEFTLPIGVLEALRQYGGQKDLTLNQALRQLLGFALEKQDIEVKTAEELKNSCRVLKR